MPINTALSATANQLTHNELRWTCPENEFNFNSTAEIEPLENIVGQERAIEAIRLGAGIFSKGYNIFVSGLSGTGRLTTVKRILQEVAQYKPVLYDYCYVNNFQNPDQPRLVKLEKGQAKHFAKAMDDAIVYLRSRLPKIFDDPSFQNSRKKIIENYQQIESKLLEEFDSHIRPYGFIRSTIENQQGTLQQEVFPVIGEQPIRIEDIEEFVATGKINSQKADEIKKLYHRFHNEIVDLSREGMKLMQEFRKELLANDKAAAAVIVNSTFDQIAENFKLEKILIYINEVKKYILDNLLIFFPAESQEVADAASDVKYSEPFNLFYVNVVLDNSSTDCAPLIVETTPSYANLFGTIERVYDSRGFWRSDFSKIKAGALLRADQGYLIVNALDLFTEQGVWPALKRVLLYNKLEIQPLDSIFNLSQSYLKPEPVEVNLKVVIIGGQTLYRMLYLYEKGFKKIFKVNAQFDYEINRNDLFINHIARFIAKTCQEENLPHCDKSAVSAISEFAALTAGSQKKLTLKFSDLADILRESSFYRVNNGDLITRSDVDKAIKWRRHRNNLLDEKIRYQIIEGSMMIDTKGERVGQINGLTVYDTGILSFGKPARITATISAGNQGIINIEREVEMSGAIHSKGILIISGYLRQMFARRHPLSLTASIAFEQSYGGIDGDSASAAEIYVILSAISQIPIKQSIAITGSVNQLGDIQPIGGVNEKITGFYEICKDQGFTGGQGVIIPHQNQSDLMLQDEIIESVRAGEFNIWTISRIEQGIEILMGIEAGKSDTKGNYTKNSLFNIVQKKIDQLFKLSSQGKDEKDLTPRKQYPREPETDEQTERN